MTTAATGRVRDRTARRRSSGGATCCRQGLPRGVDGRHRHRGRHHRLGIYRHFDSKAAILVALFERVTDDLLSDQQRIIDREPDLARALDQLIAGQVEFVVGDRAIVRVYHNEINHLPDEDQSRLRRKQRLYLEEWVHVVRELRPDLDDAYARTLVHAAIGAIQSTLFHNVGLPEDRLRIVLSQSASDVLRPRPG